MDVMLDKDNKRKYYLIMITNETLLGGETMRISYKLKIERARAGLTVDGLAKKSKVDSQTISRIEKGSTEPRISTIGKIANALNIDVEELIGE